MAKGHYLAKIQKGKNKWAQTPRETPAPIQCLKEQMTERHRTRMWAGSALENTD